MGNFTVPNERQKALIRKNNIDPEPFSVILENDSCLAMLNHLTGDEVTITKGFKTRREEQDGNQ